MRGLVAGIVLGVAAIAFAGDASARRADVANPFTGSAATRASIHFVPLDPRARRLLDAAMPVVKRWLTPAYPTEVTDIPTSKASWVNWQRRQVNAQVVLRDLQARWTQAQGGRSGFLVLVASESMYDTSHPEDRFVFGAYPVHETRTQVANIIATAQMRVFHPARERTRLTKMILRYIGVRACRLPYNKDPKSVLYSALLSDIDLDRMALKLPRRC